MSARLSGAWSAFAGALRGIPRACRLCALVALVNACVWSLLVPPFCEMPTCVVPVLFSKRRS